MLLTRELDESIRRAEIAGVRAGIETVRRLYPESRADSLEVAGGIAAFTGVESPLSQTFGVGTLTPVSAGDITRITEFYETRGATPRVFVTPLADASLGHGLASAGYAPSEYENVLVSDSFATYGMRDDRVGIAADLTTWARASAQAFTNARRSSRAMSA